MPGIPSCSIVYYLVVTYRAILSLSVLKLTSSYLILFHYIKAMCNLNTHLKQRIETIFELPQFSGRAKIYIFQTLNFLSCIGVWPINNVVTVSGEQ